MRALLLVALLSGCTVETEGLTDLLSYYEASWTCPDGEQHDLPADKTVDLPDGWRCAAGVEDGSVYADCEHDGTSVRLHCELDEQVTTSVMQVGACNVQVWCE